MLVRAEVSDVDSQPGNGISDVRAFGGGRGRRILLETAGENRTPVPLAMR
jgi:hypothetical protein